MYQIVKLVKKNGDSVSRYVDNFENIEFHHHLKRWLLGNNTYYTAKLQPYFTSYNLFLAAGLVESKTEMKKYSPKINGLPTFFKEKVRSHFIHNLAFNGDAEGLLSLNKGCRNVYHLFLSKKKQAIVQVGENVINL